MERLTISISTEQRQFLKDAVARGDYATESEVVRDLIREKQRRREAAVVSLNAALREGMEGEGMPYTPENFAKLVSEARKQTGRRRAAS